MNNMGDYPELTEQLLEAETQAAKDYIAMQPKTDGYHSVVVENGDVGAAVKKLMDWMNRKK